MHPRTSSVDTKVRDPRTIILPVNGWSPLLIYPQIHLTKVSAPVKVYRCWTSQNVQQVIECSPNMQTRHQKYRFCRPFSCWSYRCTYRMLSKIMLLLIGGSRCLWKYKHNDPWNRWNPSHWSRHCRILTGPAYYWMGQVDREVSFLLIEKKFNALGLRSTWSSIYWQLLLLPTR